MQKSEAKGEKYATAAIASVRNKCGENLWSGATPPAVFTGDGSESPVMADPDNFQVSWCHARDYKLIVMNPFGRKAFSKGEESRLIVSCANPPRLNYALFFHESNSVEDYHEPDVYRDFLEQTIQRQRK